MNPESNFQEFDELIGSLLSDTLTGEQHKRLEEILFANPELQEEYLRYIDLHLALRRTCSIRRDPDPLADLQLHHRRIDRVKQRHPVRPYWKFALAGVLVLMAAWGVSQRPGREQLAQSIQQEVASAVEKEHSPSPSREIPAASGVSESVPEVVLISAAGAELVREIVPALGAAMQLNHEYVLLKGQLELKFASQATVILQGPAVFSLNSSDRMELKIGDCSVFAPDSAKGFEVRTPRSRVVDLGTRFSLSVNDFGHSDVHVVEGAAEIHPDSDSATVATLLQGDAARCTTAAEAPQAIDFNPGRYRSNLPDRVISYNAAPSPLGSGVRDLETITVQRGGQPIAYNVNDLIRFEILQFSAHANRGNVASDELLPERVEELLTHDRALTTGLINFDRHPANPPDAEQVVPNRRERSGLAIQFDRPVRNCPGPDVVLFELQSVVYPPEGDHFRVSPLEPGDGLHPHVVERFDITLNSENALEVGSFRVFTFEKPVNDLGEFGTINSTRGGTMPLPFYALAVGIDLSDLGYAIGDQVPGLFFEDANHDPSIVIDPVFIGGLPPIHSSGNAAAIQD